MTILIQVLLVMLLVMSFFAVARLWSVLGSVRVTLTNLETTRQEVTATVQRLDETVANADKLLREEVAPTLQVARTTLANVEVTTRALAETTTSLRRLTGKAATANDARQLITAGTTLAQALTRRKQEGSTAKSAGRSLLSAVGAGLFGLFARGKQARNDRGERPQTEPAASKALPGNGSSAGAKQVESNGRNQAPRLAPPASDATRRNAELHTTTGARS
jgi:hypothetical protein